MPQDESAYLTGELADWPTKVRMTSILRQGRLTVTVGRYSIRIDDCAHFVIQSYGGDLGPPEIDADADSTDQMLTDAQRVSQALAAAEMRHRFEVYDATDRLVGYFHWCWPPDT